MNTDDVVSLFNEALEDLAANGGQLKVIELIREERRRQDAKWGFPQRNTAAEWITILTEEVGEAAQEALRLTFDRDEKRMMEHIESLRRELIQVAAVAVGALESLDHGVVSKGAPR